MLKTIFKEVFVDISIPTLLISTFLLFFSVINNIPILSLISSIFLFTSFDYVGFSKILSNNKTNSTNLIPYRILQSTLQYSLTYLLYFKFGEYIATEFILLWWFGICDLLYYIIGLEPFWRYGKFTWIWWTPFGIISKIFNFDLNYKHLIIQSIIGIIITILSMRYIN